MQSLISLGRALYRTFKEHLRPLVAFHLLFTLLASALLLPAIGWVAQTLLSVLNRTVISTEALVALLFSPIGLVTLSIALWFGFLLIYWQQAGMLLVASRPRGGRYRLAFEALWQSTKRLPALSGLVILQVGAHLLLLAPFMAALAFLHEVLLSGIDLYYLQRVRPPVLWYFIAGAFPLVLGWMALAAWLYLRWMLALPLVAIEGLSPLSALKQSVPLTRGWRRSIGAAVLTLLALIVLLPILVTWLFDLIVTPLLWWLPERSAVLIPAMLAYLTGFVLITLTITFLGVALNALLSACLYQRLAERSPPAPSETRRAGRFAWALEAFVLLFAALQAWWILNSFELRDDVKVIAHRGSSMVAPENTLAAVRHALEDRADLVELDVRLSLDNEVLLYHDRSLTRLTGDPRDFGELTREELSLFDIGSWFGDAFVGERIAGLDETLALVRGKAGLMIDMKASPGDEQRLAQAVIEALERESDIRYRCWATQQSALDGMSECGFPNALLEMRVATMTPALARWIKEQAPALRVTLLAQLILPGTLDRRHFDALGLRHNRVTRQEIELAARYGYEIHAWTVNDRARMSTLIDQGVDAIITDYPDRLSALMQDRHALSDGGLLLVKLRNWLRE
ncbi:glycerophosphodiester phosphodiesterase family protein [Halomonas sp. HNIBRBA4712]|uniref:glycerophosphodiester phosphodiesterase family protein n=1 Tax=Halomonas sp. HNIBRBA4712 TaxID=3373087 RepID=UPI0037474310